MEENKIERLDLNKKKLIIEIRRELIPLWIKIFLWIFLVFGAFAPLGLVLGLFGFKFQIALYGLETYNPLSLIGISLIGIFLLKGIAAFGLWTGKDWAILIGRIDAITGIIICVFLMTVYPFIDSKIGFNLNLRFELVLLIPFLMKLENIRKDWIDIAMANN